jgi:hypothetical protein
MADFSNHLEATTEGVANFPDHLKAAPRGVTDLPDHLRAAPRGVVRAPDHLGAAPGGMADFPDYRSHLAPPPRIGELCPLRHPPSSLRVGALDQVRQVRQAPRVLMVRTLSWFVP